MTRSIEQITALQRAQQAVDALAEIGHRHATEHLHALEHCREDLARISAACTTLVGDCDSAVDGVGKLIGLVDRYKRELDEATEKLGALLARVPSAPPVAGERLPWSPAAEREDPRGTK